MTYSKERDSRGELGKMKTKYRVKPVKHHHQKKCGVRETPPDPVLARRVSSYLKIQEDVLAKAPIVTSYGRNRICIENYRSILEYQTEQIRIQTKLGKIIVKGEALLIAYYREECMCIIGDIREILYQS